MPSSASTLQLDDVAVGHLEAPGASAAAYRGAMAVAVWTMAGLGLRVAAARGDLWLDEIWSYRLVERAGSLQAIFFALPYDNNHLLNSAWLWLVGPDAPSLLARLPAIVFGTLCIPVAARIAARRRPELGPWVAALIALDGIFVQYGSEARGYAGLMLAGLLAIDGLERLLADRRSRGSWWLLCLATAFGTLSHLTMIGITLALGATAIVRAAMGRDAKVAAGAIAALALGTLPAVVCLVVSVCLGGLHLGTSTAFSFGSFVDGMGRLVEMTLGLPCEDRYNAVAALLGAMLCVAGLVYVAPDRRVFPAVAIFAIGAVDIVLRVPNEQFPRYHFAACLGMIVLAIDVSAQARQRGIGLALRACLGLAIAAQSYNLVRLVEDGRGHFRDAVATMGADGPTIVAIAPSWMIGETRSSIDWYAEKLGATIGTTNEDCAAGVGWLLRLGEPTEALKASPRYSSAQPGCAARFALNSAYPAYGLSGFTWLLYRRVPASPRD